MAPAARDESESSEELSPGKGCAHYLLELKEGNRKFWVNGHGVVKFLTLGLLIAALNLFNSTPKVHPILIIIIYMDLAITAFFFLIYTFVLNRYLRFILWPVADLLNDLAACVFLGGGAFFASRKVEKPFNYFVAMILMAVAAFLCFIDVCLQRRHFKGKKPKKNVPGAPGAPGAGAPGAAAK
ncbi:CKLF-like MARVEL transmembrane domain-containing protein 2 [Cavia porcellus]|uniref:CKLF-like MARVEL transmembrane domain-containing protein 2 n=1 Tax=Cavia porcellus TaxID=10141 RepID=UPI0003510D5F|nr:CKLF-like MARVEL transmembrane domain-containing protein 2 [Cavia porcellus]